MLFTRALQAVLVLCLLGGCASSGGQATSGKAGKDEIASYKRTLPVAPPPPAFQEIGSVDNNGVTLTLTPRLAADQAREQCDQQPVERIMIPPQRIRRCIRPTSQGCGEYEAASNEDQPECLERCFTCGLKTIIGSPPLAQKAKAFACEKRADPNLPTPGYRYAKDCYLTPATSAVLGRLRVYAVPSGTVPSGISPNRQPIAEVALPQSGAPQQVRLSQQIDSDSCLAIADAEGQPIPVRANGSNIYLFATPRMKREQEIAEAERLVQLKNETLATQRNAVATARVNLTKQVAWRGDRCVAPPMRALPPEPVGGLSADEIDTHAKGYCAILLMYQINDAKVMQAAMAEEEIEYVESAMHFRADLTKVAKCVRKSYKYSPRAITDIRGGTEAPREEFDETLAQTGNPGTALFEALKTMVDVGTRPQVRTNALIVKMLNDCYSTASAKCESPRDNWQREVARIQSEPQVALNGCTIAVNDLSSSMSWLQSAERDAAEAEQALRAIKQRQPATSLSLSAAECLAQR